MNTITKKMTLTVMLAFLLVTVCGVAYAAENNDMALELGYFQPSLTFNAHYSNNVANAQDVNFKDDLGMGNKNATEYRLWLNKNLRLSYTNWSFDGSKTLTQDITYGNSTYSAGFGADSHLGVDYYRLTWLRPITKSEALDTSWLIDLKGFKFDTSITGHDNITNTTKTESKSFAGAIPTIGFRAATKLQGETGVVGFAEVSGLPLGKYGHFYDMEIGAKYQFNKQAAASVAYRTFDLAINDGKDNGDKAQLKQSGPYFEVVYKF